MSTAFHQARLALLTEVLGERLLLEAFPGHDELADPVQTVLGATPGEDTHRVDADWLEDADELEFAVVVAQLKSRCSARRVRYVAELSRARRLVSASR